MYADRLEGEARASVKNRLYGDVLDNSSRRLPVNGKRQRQDGNWKRDLYEGEQPQISHKLDGGDLRLKLRRKSSQQDTNTGPVGDLRQKLSGLIHSQQIKNDPPEPKPKTKPEPKTAKRTVAVEAPAAKASKVSYSSSRKNNQLKADASVDGFLQSLGLEKYIITFQAEEVDMTTLEHLNDEDLKAMGIPMGPRKKILIALDSRV